MAALVLTTTLLMAALVLLGAPSGLAQVESDQAGAPPTDSAAGPDGCPPVADVPPEDDGAPPPDDVAMLCPPTPMLLPQVAPTETPTPEPAPTSTPTPTPTPEPAATSTPTPEPPQPTPTPTSGSRNVPAGTLSRQLPFANPGDSSCDILIDSADQPSCEPQTFPAIFNIQFSPWSNTVPITVQVDNRKAATTSAMSFDVLSVPGGLPSGNHTFMASETIQNKQLSARLRLTVLKATSPHYLVYPRSVPPGTQAQIYLAGFPADTDLPLGIYRERQDCTTFGQGRECFELVHDLGTIKTTSDGTAMRGFTVAVNEPRTAYLVATPDLKVSGSDVATALRTYGRPWFVVGQP
ncbi:MAG TPA: hypothetical protein VGQ62_20085 [Chloroflexota bacterium]|nr:hypothetical protein [Chloroflexota bacterium]